MPGEESTSSLCVVKKQIKITKSFFMRNWKKYKKRKEVNEEKEWERRLGKMSGGKLLVVRQSKIN